MADLTERLEQDKAAIHSLVVRDTEDIIATRSADGTRLRFRNKVNPSSGGGGGQALVPALITGGSGLVYTADIYDAYLGNKVATGVAIIPMQVNYLYQIPVGTWVMAATVSGYVHGDGSGL